MKNYDRYIKESVLDTYQDKLSLDLWEDEQLKPKAKKQILSKLEEWLKELKLLDKLKSVQLVGSLCTYQYNEYSDIDVNFELDIPENRRERLTKLLPNGKNLEGTNHPINYYLLAGKTLPNKNTQSAIYDILNDEWIKKPTKEQENLPEMYKACIDSAISWARKISLDLDELNRDIMELKIYRHFLDEGISPKKEIENSIKTKEQEIKADYDILRSNHHILKLFRYEAYAPENNEFDSKTLKTKSDHPDYSYNNIVYKILEKFKYLEKIDDTIKQCKEKFPELFGES